MTIPTRTKSAHMLAERDLIDAGSGPGVLELLDSGGTVLARGNLADPCGDTSNTDTLTLTGPIVLTAIATGTPVSGRLRDSAGTDVRPGLSVGTSGTQIVLSLADITQVGQTVTISSATVQHAA